MSYKDRLAKMTKKMAEQQADYTPGGFQPIPDGTYNFRIKMFIDEWKAKDDKPARLYVGVQFIVDGGEHDGRMVNSNCGLEEKVGSHILRGIIEDLGYEWPADDLGQLEEIVNDITNRAPLVTGTAKTKPQKNNPEYTNTNIRIQDVLELPDGAVASEDNDPTDSLGPDDTFEGKEEDPDAAARSALLDYAASQGIDGFTEDHSLSDMVDALKSAELEKVAEDSISDEEKELLKSLDLFDVLVAAKPKAKAVVKTTPKISAKPVLKGKGKK